MIEWIDSYTWPKRNSRKHNRGSAPCYRCECGHHNRCRPRLDNTLCTCACPTAEELRQQAALLPPDLSEQEKVKEFDRLGLIPPSRKQHDEDFLTPALNRQDISAQALDKTN
jgi:hypothetical protein